MKASQFLDEQMVQILQEAERGDQSIGAICRAHSITETTFYRWRCRFGGMTVSEVQRLKELEYDFVHDHCLHRTPLKLLLVMDEFTREDLAIVVATTMPSERVRAVFAGLFAQHGAPTHLRSDNGPEFIAENLRVWLAQRHTATIYIDPGCPWQNGYGESVNSTVRDECLNLYAFASITEAHVILERYRREYNEERPHSSLSYRTPTEFKRA